MTTAFGTLTIKAALALAGVFLFALGVAGASGTLSGKGHTGITNEPIGVTASGSGYNQTGAVGGYTPAPTPVRGSSPRPCTVKTAYGLMSCMGGNVPTAAPAVSPVSPVAPGATPGPTSGAASGWWCCPMHSWAPGAAAPPTGTSPGAWGGMMRWR